MRDCIILDNGSTIDLFTNKDFVTKIKKSKKPMELYTNTGSKINTTKAIVNGYGEVWYDENAIANIFSLKGLLKDNHITFDSKKANAFFVTNKNTGKTPD